jgi:membrane-associated protein
VNPLDVQDIVATLGTMGVLIGIFVETGLLLGLFLPGDSLLFLAGIAASGTAKEIFGNQLSYTQLMIWAPIAATGGSQFGYWLGARFGRPFFNRPDSRFYNQEKVAQTERWLNKYGVGKALVISHFVPFARTILNPLCGVVGIPAKKFFIWNLIGSYLWTVGFINAGYLLGEELEGSIDHYLLPVVGVIVLVTFLPITVEFIRDRRQNRSTDQDR